MCLLNTKKFSKKLQFLNFLYKKNREFKIKRLRQFIFLICKILFNFLIEEKTKEMTVKSAMFVQLNLTTHRQSCPSKNSFYSENVAKTLNRQFET